MDSIRKQIVSDPIRYYPSATVACFDPTDGDLPRRKLDSERTATFMQRLASEAVPAVLIGASTGQGHLRTEVELLEWMKLVQQIDMGGTHRIALLRPEDSLTANQKLIEEIRLTYPVAFIRPATNSPANMSSAELVAQIAPLQKLIAESGMLVGLYSIPDVSGVRLGPETVVRLLDQPGGDKIVAIKITESSYEESTLRFLNEPKLNRLKIVQGWDPFIARAMQDGGSQVGITSGPMSFALYQYLHLLDAAKRRDWNEVEVAQCSVTALFAAMQDDPNKFADLQRAKYLMGLGHPMLSTIKSEQVERVMHALQKLPRIDDRVRLARSLDLMQAGPYHAKLAALADIHT